jgi:steroid delta-isomerase-like uncharacterized protein
MTDLKSLGRRFYDEVFNNGAVAAHAALDEILADDFVEHEEVPGFAPDRAGVIEFFSMMHRAFPDISVEVKAMAVDGDQLLTHAVMRGTHRGEFMDIPATGRKVEVALADRTRFRDGRAVEHWGVTDMMAMMEQLGVIGQEP